MKPTGEPPCGVRLLATAVPLGRLAAPWAARRRSHAMSDPNRKPSADRMCLSEPKHKNAQVIALGLALVAGAAFALARPAGGRRGDFHEKARMVNTSRGSRTARNGRDRPYTMPSPQDYAFMWWAYGWRGRSPDGHKILCFQTGRYGLALDVEKAALLHMGTIDHAVPYAQATAQDNDVVFKLDPGYLELSVLVGQKRFRCVRAAVDQHDALNFPVRWIESGRYMQRADILQLQFEDEKGARLPAEGRLELVAWPDRMAFVLDVTPSQDLADATVRIRLDAPGMSRAESDGAPAGEPWKAGQTRTAWVALLPGSGSGPQESAPLQIRAETTASPHTPGTVTYDPARGWYAVALPPESWSEAKDLDHLDRVDLTLTNPTPRWQLARLLL